MLFKRYRYLFLLMMNVFLMVCDENYKPITPVQEEQYITIEAEYVPELSVCKWKDNHQAAYTIAFDDVRASHYEISGPELKKRGMKGTFNLNTKTISQWTPWQILFNEGNEIASHTWSHPKCTEISEEDLRNEIQKAKQDILNNIIGCTRVPSFTYPFGLFNDPVRRIVMESHHSARGMHGLNTPDLSGEDFSVLKGIGVYPPFDINVIHNYVREAVQKKGWVIVYFHSVGDSTIGDPYTTAPLDLFLEHLDYIAARRDTLWIATQGEVVDYVRVRQNAEIICEIVDSVTIEISIADNLNEDNAPRQLSLLWKIPQNWLNKRIIITDENMKQTDMIEGSNREILINLLSRRNMNIRAKGIACE